MVRNIREDILKDNQRILEEGPFIWATGSLGPAKSIEENDGSLAVDTLLIGYVSQYLV